MDAVETLSRVKLLYTQAVTLEFVNAQRETLAIGKFVNCQELDGALEFDLKIEHKQDGVLSHINMHIQMGPTKSVTKRVPYYSERIEGEPVPEGMFIPDLNITPEFKLASPIRIGVDNTASRVESVKKAKGAGVVFRAQLPANCERCGGTQWTKCDPPLYPPVPADTPVYECSNPDCLQYEYLKQED